uniref:Basic leucine zipper 9-like n=1 Tax=Elaeis guineensis var. tenera TaxID=51953 RepID=A0A6I9RGS3_ELAGV|nr:basic leucine zipper 9-like [Elaeis guineensis]
MEQLEQSLRPEQSSVDPRRKRLMMQLEELSKNLPRPGEGRSRSRTGWKGKKPQGPEERNTAGDHKSQASSSHSSEQPLDSKRLRRLKNNRESCKRSWLRRELKKFDLEDTLQGLKRKVELLRGMVAYYTHRQAEVETKNKELQSKLTNLLRDSHIKEAKRETLAQELQQLKELHGIQQKILMQQSQQAQQSQQNFKMPLQAFQPSPIDNFRDTNIFFKKP